MYKVLNDFQTDESDSSSDLCNYVDNNKSIDTQQSLIMNNTDMIFTNDIHEITDPQEEDTNDYWKPVTIGKKLWMGNTTVVFSDTIDSNEDIGKGKMETLDTNYQFEDIDYYHWRRTLSIHCYSPFTLDNLVWENVSCFYHANKFKYTQPQWYRMLSQMELDSIKKFCIDNRKHIDSSFKLNRSMILYQGTKAKYEENKQLADILIKTYPAKLLLYENDNLYPAHELMKVRMDLIKIDQTRH